MSDAFRKIAQASYAIQSVRDVGSKAVGTFKEAGNTAKNFVAGKFGQAADSFVRTLSGAADTSLSVMAAQHGMGNPFAAGP